MASPKLVIWILSIGSLVIVSNAFNFEQFRLKRELEDASTEQNENCDKFPRHAYRCDCCVMPDDVLGNLTSSFKMCFGKKWEEFRQKNNEGGQWQQKDKKFEKQEISTTPAGTGSDKPTTDAEGPRGPEGPRKHFHRGPKDGCLMECVFQDQNWLKNGKVDTERIVERIHQAKKVDPMWVEVAEKAVDFCAKVQAEPDKKCQSGSEEFFMCLGRFIFTHCPEFKDENEGCETLKSFYEQCGAKHPVPLKCHQGYGHQGHN